MGDTMKRALGTALLFAGLSALPQSLRAQAEVGADLALYSSYVWRGLSLTNKPVAEPAVYLTFPAGKASVTVGGWTNFDLGKYDDVENDISESGGLSAFNLSEFDPYAEVSFPVGKATLTGGLTGYIYPNDVDEAPNGGLGSDANTWEIYGKASFEVPLSPEFSIYYDVDKIKGAYMEGSVSHSLPVGENLSVDVGALAGLSAGQGIPDDPDTDESFNFADDGLTHVDLSAGLPLTAGQFSITPEFHFVIGVDDAVKVTGPLDESDVKIWLGGTISWSRTLGEEAEEEAAAEVEE
jgi:Bacterial protein of unknown function (Gcw_chp)